MKTFARIENDVVIEVLQSPTKPAFHPALEWIEVAPGQVQPGYVRRADGGLVPPDQAGR